MSRKPENSLIAAVHRHLPDELHKEKMANPYRKGTADVWYSGCKADLWVEYKWLPRVPARADVALHRLPEPLQARWLRGRHREGRSVALVVGCPGGAAWLPGLSWDCEISAAAFRAMLTTKRDLAAIIQRHTLASG